MIQGPHSDAPIHSVRPIRLCSGAFGATDALAADSVSFGTPDANRRAEACYPLLDGATSAHSTVAWICYHLGAQKTLEMDIAPMKAIELVGDIDEQHRLQAQVPEELPAGPVRLIVLLPDEDEGGAAWVQGVTREWSDGLQDSRQDIYTLEDGQPVNAPR